MKPVRWSRHALANLSDREIDRAVADLALATPELVTPAGPMRRVAMRRYMDSLLGREILLRLVLDETEHEVIVVTVYKTSNIGRYLKGVTP